MKIECEDVNGEIQMLFNGQEDEFLEELLWLEMRNPQQAVAGTYWPQFDSMLNALNVLQNQMFTKIKSIDVEGDIGTIPQEEPGVIY